MNKIENNYFIVFQKINDSKTFRSLDQKLFSQSYESAQNMGGRLKSINIWERKKLAYGGGSIVSILIYIRHFLHKVSNVKKNFKYIPHCGNLNFYTQIFY